MAKEKATITGAMILGAFIMIYLINEVCKVIFLPLLIATIIGLAVAIMRSFLETDYILYAWIGVVTLIILTIVSYGCGYGFYNTEIGKTLVDAGNISYEVVNTMNEAEQIAEDTIKNISKQIIDETINATNLSNPQGSYGR